MNTKRQTLVEVGVVLAALWAPLLVASLRSRGMQPQSTDPMSDPIGTMITRATGTAILWLVVRRGGEDIARFGVGRPRWPHVAMAVVLVAATLAITVAVSAGHDLLLRPHWRELPVPTVGFPGPWHHYWLFVPISVAFQEFLMRSYLVTRFVDLWRSPSFAVLASSLLYALWHLYLGWDAALTTFFFGLLYGWTLLRTGSVWPALGAHIAMNLVALSGLSSLIIRAILVFASLPTMP